MEWFIQLHRKMLEWEWYDDINTTRLFIHILIKANWSDKNWRWIIIKRWEFLTSLWKLSEETGLTLQQIRTCIKKLKLTSELTSEWHSSYTLFKVKNYDDYQTSNIQPNNQITNKEQTNNKQVTTTNNNNKINNKNKKNKYGEYKNILLTQSQKDKLIIDYSEVIFNQYVKIVDEWIQMKGYKYKDHNLVIRKWINKDKENWKVITSVSNDYEKVKADKMKRLEQFKLNNK